MPETENTPKHIAVLAFPFATHAAPLLSLVRRISEAAPDVLFSFFSTAQSNNQNFSKIGALGNIKPYDVSDGFPEGYVFSGKPNEPVEFFLKATPQNFKTAVEVAVAETGRKVTCLMSDAFFWFGAEMAAEMNVAWVPLWTAGPRGILVHLETDVIRQHLGFNGSKDETLELIPDFSSIRAADLPTGIISDMESPISMMLHKMGLNLPQATATAANSFDELDSTVVNFLKSKLPNFLNVGPFVLTCPHPSPSDSYVCIDWLGQHEPASVAYISFGSVITPPPNELAALAEALEAGRIPFLWSFRGNADEKLPKGFVERTKEYGKIVPWAPQLRVLEHTSVGVFVTHCGWNSILESIIGGVPMICRPFFGDQQLNCRTVEAVWEIGLGVENGAFTKEGTMKALKVILSSEQGKKMRERLGVRKEFALKAVESDGSSTKNFKTLVEVVTK